jgi:hypothetical protein
MRRILPKSGADQKVSEPLCRYRERADHRCHLPVLSSQLEFDPKGSQAQSFADRRPQAAVGGILIAKMRGGQVRPPE